MNQDNLHDLHAHVCVNRIVTQYWVHTQDTYNICFSWQNLVNIFIIYKNWNVNNLCHEKLFFLSLKKIIIFFNILGDRNRTFRIGKHTARCTQYTVELFLIKNFNRFLNLIYFIDCLTNNTKMQFHLKKNQLCVQIKFWIFLKTILSAII